MYVTCDIMEMPAVMESKGFAPDCLCIYMHLIPKQVARQELREMLEPWVLRGARVITSVYHPPYWEPAECDETYNLNLYTSSSEGVGTKSGEDAGVREKAIPPACLKCNKRPVEFVCFPCDCPCFCKGCAMKLATGGKCKQCNEFFSELRKLR